MAEKVTAEKSLAAQIEEGIAYALGLDKPTPQQIKTVPRGKGVILPKLTPVPTIKRGRNANAVASPMLVQKERAQNGRFASLNQRLKAIEAENKVDAKRDADLRKLVLGNKAAIAENTKLIEKQKRWVEFMFKKWAEKNKAALKNMGSTKRRNVAAKQKAMLKRESKKRIQPRCNYPMPQAPFRPAAKPQFPKYKKKARIGFRGKKSYLNRQGCNCPCTTNRPKLNRNRRSTAKAPVRVIKRTMGRNPIVKAPIRVIKRPIGRNPIIRANKTPMVCRPANAPIRVIKRPMGSKPIVKAPIRVIRRPTAKAPIRVISRSTAKKRPVLKVTKKILRYTPAGMAINAIKNRRTLVQRKAAKVNRINKRVARRMDRRAKKPVRKVLKKGLKIAAMGTPMGLTYAAIKNRKKIGKVAKKVFRYTPTGMAINAIKNRKKIGKVIKKAMPKIRLRRRRRR